MYTVQALTVEGCGCEECRAGRHLYELCRWEGGGWRWVGISLQTYTSAEQCKRYLYWGDFGPEDKWENGTPITEPEWTEQDQRPPSGTGRRLNTNALLHSAKLLETHWRQ